MFYFGLTGSSDYEESIITSFMFFSCIFPFIVLGWEWLSSFLYMYWISAIPLSYLYWSGENRTREPFLFGRKWESLLRSEILWFCNLNLRVLLWREITCGHKCNDWHGIFFLKNELSICGSLSSFAARRVIFWYPWNENVYSTFLPLPKKKCLFHLISISPSLSIIHL